MNPNAMPNLLRCSATGACHLCLLHTFCIYVYAMPVQCACAWCACVRETSMRVRVCVRVRERVQMPMPICMPTCPGSHINTCTCRYKGSETFCANEGSWCHCKGKVHYGRKFRYATRTLSGAYTTPSDPDSEKKFGRLYSLKEMNTLSNVFTQEVDGSIWCKPASAIIAYLSICSAYQVRNFAIMARVQHKGAVQLHLLLYHIAVHITQVQQQRVRRSCAGLSQAMHLRHSRGHWML